MRVEGWIRTLGNWGLKLCQHGVTTDQLRWSTAMKGCSPSVAREAKIHIFIQNACLKTLKTILLKKYIDHDVWQKPTQYCNYPSIKNKLKTKTSILLACSPHSLVTIKQTKKINGSNASHCCPSGLTPALHSHGKRNGLNKESARGHDHSRRVNYLIMWKQCHSCNLTL